MRPVSALRPLLRGALPAVLSALVLGACGGSSSTSSSAPAAQTSASGSAPSSASTTSSATAGTSTTAGTGSASTTSAAPTAGAAAVSGCPTSSLHLAFVSGQGAAGTAFMTYALINSSHTTCTLIGYPGVSILDAAGRIVQHPAQRGGIQTPTRVRLVTLPAGRQARFIVTSSDVIPSPGCSHAFTGTTLQVFPPNQRQALKLPHSGQFCNLHVGPVQGPH
ncbi:MAG: hypothetical protein QOF83_171 [Solirubrobacteraceae bacterium]|nr:hypothetical protein [Solirubrobacteraceae bacterium]